MMAKRKGVALLVATLAFGVAAPVGLADHHGRHPGALKARQAANKAAHHSGAGANTDAVQDHQEAAAMKAAARAQLAQDLAAVKVACRTATHAAKTPAELKAAQVRCHANAAAARAKFHQAIDAAEAHAHD